MMSRYTLYTRRRVSCWILYSKYCLNVTSAMLAHTCDHVMYVHAIYIHYFCTFFTDISQEPAVKNIFLNVECLWIVMLEQFVGTFTHVFLQVLFIFSTVGAKVRFIDEAGDRCGIVLRSSICKCLVRFPMQILPFYCHTIKPLAFIIHFLITQPPLPRNLYWFCNCYQMTCQRHHVEVKNFNIYIISINYCVIVYQF